MPLVADARSASGAGDSFAGALLDLEIPQLQVTQSCKTLSQAIDSIRRGGNVERVISAETRESGGRKVHHIKVLTKDGKVKTHRVSGC